MSLTSDRICFFF